MINRRVNSTTDEAAIKEVRVRYLWEKYANFITPLCEFSTFLAYQLLLLLCIGMIR